MEIYLVGGAIRNALLGLPAQDRDWVVVGATPEDMIANGFTPVGKDFPVFLHPETKEEYALARTERKTHKGYTGFQFYAAPDVTLEQDLKRRDLTINAIAQDQQGKLIDPFNGQADLNAQCLRHVSSAFTEDPVRILRIARFAATLTGFTVHPETNQLMNDMVKNGEVDALMAERVCKEFLRAIAEPSPQRFFSVLADCGALPVLLPEFTLSHLGFQALQRAASKHQTTAIRFACLCHGLQKTGIQSLCERIRIPKSLKTLAILAQEHQPSLANLPQLTPEAVLSLIKQLDALRRPERYQDFVAVAQICLSQTTLHEHIQRLNACIDGLKKIDTQSLQDQKLIGAEFAHALQKQQLAVIQTLLR